MTARLFRLSWLLAIAALAACAGFCREASAAAAASATSPDLRSWEEPAAIEAELDLDKRGYFNKRGFINRRGFFNKRGETKFPIVVRLCITYGLFCNQIRAWPFQA